MRQVLLDQQAQPDLPDLQVQIALWLAQQDLQDQPALQGLQALQVLPVLTVPSLVRQARQVQQDQPAQPVLQAQQGLMAQLDLQDRLVRTAL